MNQLLREEGKRRRTDSVPTSILVVFLWMVVMLCSSSVREKVLFVVRLVGFDDDDIWLVGQRVRLVGSVSSGPSRRIVVVVVRVVVVWPLQPSR